jgi:hypothetical protein
MMASTSSTEPKRELEALLKVKKGHRPVFKLGPDDAFRFETETVSIKRDSPLKVVDAEGDHGERRFHFIGVLE